MPDRSADTHAELVIDVLSEFMVLIRHALARCVSSTWVDVGDRDPVGGAGRLWSIRGTEQGRCCVPDD